MCFGVAGNSAVKTSMAIENRPKIAKTSFAASVPLSKMLKLRKVIRIMIKQIVGIP